MVRELENPIVPSNFVPAGYSEEDIRVFKLTVDIVDEGEFHAYTIQDFPIGEWVEYEWNANGLVTLVHQPEMARRPSLFAMMLEVQRLNDSWGTRRLKIKPHNWKEDGF